MISFDIKELIAEDGINISSKENYRFFFLATVIFIVGLLVVLFIEMKLTPVNMEADIPKEEEKPDENEFFLSLEKYIRDHLDEVNIAQIRERAGLSKHAFYTKFVKHFGKNPKEYLSEIKAKALQERQNELFRKRNLLEN